MRTANPALNDKSFQTRSSRSIGLDDRMTLTGTVNKSFLLICMVFTTAIWSWYQAIPASPEAGPQIPIWYWGALIGALIVAFIVIFKKHTAPYLAPVYALLEGVVLGLMSSLFEQMYPGIVFQAILGTAAVFAGLLFVYKSGMIKVTDNFRLGVAAATGGVFLIYMLTFVLSFFGINMPYIHEGGLIGIGFSLLVIGIASMNLVLDFDFIEGACERGAPKYMEWYASFGLLVTLIWLYIEILRLLAKLQRR